MASSRLGHVLVQGELETFAIETDGSVVWRIAHSDVVTGAELVGGRLVLTSYSGQLNAVDPATGRPAG
jgi:outer membrane protein assembly factor BamB